MMKATKEFYMRVSVFVAVILGMLNEVESIRGTSNVQVTNVQIVIVGAGASGIAAGAYLLENGINNFVILEAEHYYGGRVNTVKFGNEYVDLGAEWVHGEEGNVVFDMANRLQLIAKSEYETAFIESSGKLLNEHTAEQLYNVLDGISDSAYKELQNYKGSLGEYFNQEYPKKLQEKSVSSSSVSKEFLDWFEKGLNVDDASDSWFITSGHGYTEYKRCAGHQEWSWKSGGYSTVLDLLMKKIPNTQNELPLKDKIYHQCEVDSIVWDNLPEDYDNKVLVKCRNGDSFFADNAIVTVSLGVLKETAPSVFKPALPAKKINAIQGLAYGTVDKIFLEFPNKWWPDEYGEFGLLWNSTDECKTKIINSSDQTVLDACWDHFVYSFNNLNNQPNVLCGWLYGPAARYMEQLDDFVVQQKTVKLLQQFVGNAFNITVPSPTQILRSGWYSNPHFRGSYSFRSMETEARQAYASHLAEPVLNKNGKPVLLFAGEATHSTHYSTVHGAVESGWREAERAVKYLRSNGSK